ncbi:MAG: GAF domain-containing protein [Phycisphaerales bacterium]|nr:GAF domain-containing protein [Phycisphaerales bacterium]
MPTRDYHAVPVPVCATREDRMTALVDDLWRRFATAGYSWVGFYTKAQDDQMILGPRRDKPACSPIGLHGMCGLAWRERRAVVVADVRRLGHHYVACDPRDMAEVVVPLLEPDGSCWGVLDADSFEVGAFTAADARGLAALVERAGLSEPLHDRAWPILAGA